jgi:hypothetical protein
VGLSFSYFLGTNTDEAARYKSFNAFNASKSEAASSEAAGS